MKKLKIELLVSIAEIISSIAIVVSIIYVAVEFKRSDAISNKDVENHLYNSIKSMDQLVIENNDIAKLIIKASAQTDSLKEEELLRYVSFEHIFYDSWEYAFSNYQDEILEKEEWESWNEWFISEVQKKPIISWEGNRKNYNGVFLDYVDDLIAKQ